MSYPGSQQPFGLSDLQLLQQQLMYARLQELQKQQQFGQLGDGKPSSSLNNMPMYAKHAAGSQITNLGGGTPFNSSNMLSPSNLNWMHHSVSSSMQVTQGSTLSHDGLTMSSSLQQPNISFYGTPVVSGRGSLGQYSPMQEVPHSSVYMLSANSNENPISQVSSVANPFLGHKLSVPPSQGHSIDGSFMLRQGLQEKGLVGQASVQVLNSGMSSQNSPLVKIYTLPQRIGEQCGSRFLQEQAIHTNDSGGTAALDPLEEKILFDAEDSGWDSSLGKLDAIDTEEFLDASSRKEYMNAFSSIQSGSWSALMQSAVAEASSSDTGIQEELSGLSFQNTDSSIGKQPSNPVSIEQQQHDKWTDSKLQSTSNNMRAHPSSVDSVQPEHPSRSSECQQLINGPVPAGHPIIDWVASNDKNAKDFSQGSRTTGLSVSGIIKNEFGFVQQAADSHSYVPIHDDTDQKGYKNVGYDHQSSSNPMAVDALYKRAAEIYGNQNRYRGENSCDSYNSKASEADVAHTDHACLNGDDSESSARSSHKSQNQALCISSPGANSQPECFSHSKPNDAFPTNTDYLMKGKPTSSADAFSKGSPASDISASFDSQNTSEHNKASQCTDNKNTVHAGFNISQTEPQELDMPKISVSQGTAVPDKFSFQSSVTGNSRFDSLGNGRRSQTWWTPSSFGHSFPSMQGASLPQNYNGNFNVFGKTAIETSNMKNERNSFEGSFPGHLHVNNQLDGKHISKMSGTSESIQKALPEISQHISLPAFSPTQNNYPIKNVSSFNQETVTQSTDLQGTYLQGVNPLNVWKDAPSHKNMIDLSSLIGLPSRSSVMKNDSPDEQKAPKFVTVHPLKGHESAERYLTNSTDMSAYAGISVNQQGYVNSGVVQRSSSGTPLRDLPTYSQPQLLHNISNIKQQEDIGDTDLNKVDYNSSALYYLNQQRIPNFSGHQTLHELHEVAKNNVGNRFDLCSSGDKMIPAWSSGISSNLPSVPSAMQLPHKEPVFSQGYSSGNNILSDRIRHMQNEYSKNRQMLSPCDSAALMSIKASENLQLNGTITNINGFPANTKYDILQGLVDQMAPSGQSLSSVLPSDANVNLVPSRPRKRKAAIYECLPWHKEVITTRVVLPDISTADQEWAEVANRLIDKCVGGGERNEEMQPAVSSKRRLILTTKLMQLVFRPPPPTVLSVNASVEYETVTYFITKLALADACNWANKTWTGCDMPCESGNMNTNGRTANHLSEKASELFLRIKELETHIDRLSKSVSVVDVLVECQELEKFGVINHFARYHSRVPDPRANDSASSSTSATSVRPFLQRYVSAVPLPLKLPEGVQCLSL